MSSHPINPTTFFRNSWELLRWARQKNGRGAEEIEKHTGYYKVRIRHKDSNLIHPNVFEGQEVHNLSTEEQNLVCADTYEWVRLRKAYYVPKQYKPLLEHRPFPENNLMTGYFISVHRVDKTEEQAFTGPIPLTNHIITGVELKTSYTIPMYSAELTTANGAGKLAFYAKNQDLKEQLEQLQVYLQRPTSDKRRSLESLADSLQQPVGWERLTD